MATEAFDESQIIAMPSRITAGESFVSPSAAAAAAACFAMALGYVLVLYVPTFVLRLPPPTSLESFLIRRFTCALVFSAVSVFASAALIGVERFSDLSSMLSVYGIRNDHMWQAVVIPLFLTSLLYVGSLASKSVLLPHAWRVNGGNSCCDLGLCNIFAVAARRSLDRALACAHNVVAWRNYVVAPITEELVFRACMIPLLLCSGFQILSIVFLGPVFFSLGLQLGYTVMFGWYASFLFIRTGNLISAVIAHMFCNMMGLPLVLSSSTRGTATIAFVFGLICFLGLLFPASRPILYNSNIDSCNCWQGYCRWS